MKKFSVQNYYFEPQHTSNQIISFMLNCRQVRFKYINANFVVPNDGQVEARVTWWQKNLWQSFGRLIFLQLCLLSLSCQFTSISKVIFILRKSPNFHRWYIIVISSNHVCVIRPIWSYNWGKTDVDRHFFKMVDEEQSPQPLHFASSLRWHP